MGLWKCANKIINSKFEKTTFSRKAAKNAKKNIYSVSRLSSRLCVFA